MQIAQGVAQGCKAQGKKKQHGSADSEKKRNKEDKQKTNKR